MALRRKTGSSRKGGGGMIDILINILKILIETRE
jgi:hypothetical protein